MLDTVKISNECSCGECIVLFGILPAAIKCTKLSPLSRQINAIMMRSIHMHWFAIVQCVCVWSTTACINLHVVSDSIFPLFHRFRSVTAILICWFVFDSHGWWLPVFRSSFSWASLLLKLDSLVQSNRKFLQTCKTKIKTKTTHTCGRTLLAFCRFFRAAHVWTNFV